MNELEIRQAFIAELEKYMDAGYCNEKHRELLAIYNSNPHLPRGYPMQVDDAWCAATPSAISVKLGWTHVVFPECGCGRMVDLYRSHGRWVESDSYVPNPADLVMYDWDDDGVGDNTGNPWHVGTVKKVANGKITVIEGNMDNHMGIRTIPINGRYIRGFCCPDYASLANEDMTFVDVPAHAWYAPGIEWAVQNGIVTGIGNRRFAPEDICTRAQAITMLWRMNDSPEPEGVYKPFVDVNPVDYFCKAVQWAIEHGIVVGVDPTHFAPNNPVTRGQVVTFFWRLHGSKPVTGDFVKDVHPTDYYYNAVYWAYEVGLTSGTGKDYFSPSDYCTRAQMATFCMNASKIG